MKQSTLPFEALIFNLDGVLVDTASYHYTAWKRLANNLEFDLSPEQHAALRGMSRMASLEKILEWGQVYLTEAEKLHLSDVKNNWYLELIAQVGPEQVLPGVVPFLKSLKAQQYRLAMVSASKSARQVLQSTGLSSFFEVVIDGHATRKSIPDPECYLLTARALGLSPNECLVFEDAAQGVQAALLSGFVVVGIGMPDYLHQAHAVIPGFEGMTLTSLALNLSDIPTISL